jgi:membrane fusion protein, multidrug efflux system
MREIILGILLISNSLFATSIYATFDIKAFKSANLAFSNGGTIDFIKVDISSDVNTNDILATLNNDDLKASLDIAKITLKFAQKDMKRQDKIRNIIDKAKYDSYEYKYENAKAQVAYKQAVYEKSILKAPFNGTIVSKNIEVGDVVTGANPKTVFQIQSKYKRKLILKFDQKYALKVNIGDTFNYKIDADNKEYRGTISKIYPAIDIATRKVIAEVITKDLTVGLFGDGYITTKK